MQNTAVKVRGAIKVLNELLSPEVLYQQSPCGYITFLADGTIIQVNNTLLNWLGLSEEDVINKKKVTDLLNKGGEFYYRMIVSPLLNLQGFVNEINFEICSGDKSFPCLFSANAIGWEAGQPLQVVNATVFNITDRKKYEAELLRSKQLAEDEKKKLEFLCNSIPNIVFTTAGDGCINFLNARFYEYFNVPEETYKDKILFNTLVHRDERFSVLKAWIRAVRQGSRFESEMRLKSPFKESEYFLVRAVPFTNSGGVITSWFGSCTNIDPQKQQQLEAISRLNDDLSEAGQIIDSKSRRLNEVAFNQAHLVRSPLSNILGLVALIKDMEMDDQLRDLFSMIEFSAGQLDEVVKEVVRQANKET